MNLPNYSEYPSFVTLNGVKKRTNFCVMDRTSSALVQRRQELVVFRNYLKKLEHYICSLNKDKELYQDYLIRYTTIYNCLLYNFKKTNSPLLQITFEETF